MAVRAREPIVPVSAEDRVRYRALEGWIILGRPRTANAWQGYVEHSFAMGWHTEAANFWNADRAYGLDYNLDTVRNQHPDWEIQEFAVQDEDLPVVLDWSSWIAAQAYDPNTLSGVSSKFRARNIPFVMRDEAVL